MLAEWDSLYFLRITQCKSVALQVVYSHNVLQRLKIGFVFVFFTMKKNCWYFCQCPRKKQKLRMLFWCCEKLEKSRKNIQPLSPDVHEFKFFSSFLYQWVQSFEFNMNDINFRNMYFVLRKARRHHHGNKTLKDVVTVAFYRKPISFSKPSSF